MIFHYRTTAVLLLITSLLISSSCTSKVQKEARLRAEAEAKRPAWTKQAPINNDGYYWGVGEIQIPQSTPLTTAQKGRARQNALSDIASAISVNVNTQSLLATAKVSDQLKQTFQKTVKLISKLKLEGVEAVDSYRDAFGYFELYRLNQAKYHQQHKRTLQAALDQATQWLDALTTAKQKGDYRSALLFGLKTLNGLSDYWDEELQIVRGGKTVNPLAEADREIHELLRQTNIRAIISPLELIPGCPIDEHKVGFRVMGGEKGILRDLPLKFRSNGIKLTVSTASTNDQGLSILPIRLSSYDAKESTVTASIDIRPIIASAVVNESIEQYALRLSLPEGKLEIKQLAPQIQLVCTTQGETSKHLKEIFAREMERKGISISQSNKATTIEMATHVKSTRQKTYSTVTIEITMRYDGKNQSELMATHSAETEAEAINLCYATLTDEIRGKATGKIYYWLFGEE